MANFKAYCLSDTIIKSLNRQGYLSATPIQDLVIPKALKGNSLVVKSETGSGKTHSFIVPILQKINVDINKLQAVIVSPTRELAKQTFDFFKEFCAEMPKLSVKLISSVDERTKSVEEMSKNPQIIVATIGRLHEMLVKSSFLPLDDVKFIVLDEADMLLESGFMDDVDSVITKVGAPQLLVFSATISQSLQYILSKYIQADFFITNDSTGNTSKNVKHYGIDIKHKPIEDAVLEFLRVKPAYM
ncbi:MAG: DEAD/DEAH box helicase, partial [Bacilli bacterium]